MQFKTLTKVDFESICKKMSKPEEQPKDEFEQMRRSMRGPGPSHRLLIAHAAWKKGLTGYVEQIVALDPEYKADFEKYKLAVLDDLAWLHFLRGVNLLMFADRAEAPQHLRLVSAISSKSEFKNQADDLVKQIERLLKEKDGEAKQIDESKLSDSEKAQLYISQFRDVHCPQTSQPGGVAGRAIGVVALLFTTRERTAVELRLLPEIKARRFYCVGLLRCQNQNHWLTILLLGRAVRVSGIELPEFRSSLRLPARCFRPRQSG